MQQQDATPSSAASPSSSSRPLHGSRPTSENARSETPISPSGRKRGRRSTQQQSRRDLSAASPSSSSMARDRRPKMRGRRRQSAHPAENEVGGQRKCNNKTRRRPRPRPLHHPLGHSHGSRPTSENARSETSISPSGRKRGRRSQYKCNNQDATPSSAASPSSSSRPLHGSRPTSENARSETSIIPIRPKTRSEVNASQHDLSAASPSRPLPGSRPTSENARSEILNPSGRKRGRRSTASVLSATPWLETDVRKCFVIRKQAELKTGKRRPSSILSATPWLETDVRKWTVILNRRPKRPDVSSINPSGRTMSEAARESRWLYFVPAY